MRKPGIVVFVATAAVAMPMIAECVSYEPLSPDRGQALVKDAFRNVPFWTGAWGNDVSCLMPFQWNIPGIGIFTYFSAAEHRFSDGMTWEIDEIGSGKLLYCKHEWSHAVDIWFVPEHLFEVEYSCGKRILCYHNERMRGGDAETDGVGFIEDFTWNKLSVSTNGWPNKTFLKGWPTALFADKEFKSIHNVVPLKFRGAKAETMRDKDAICKRLDEYVGTQGGWSLDVSHKNQVVDKHRKYTFEHYKEKVVGFVYIVACDVNHDGICDAYVTSDVEAAGDDKYKWSLYLGTEAGLSRQTADEIFFANGTEKLYYETDVVVAKGDFFRVDRLNMPAYVMVLAKLNGLPESWSYMHHENPVWDFRQRNGFAKAEYYSCLANGKAGVSSIRDLFLSYCAIVRAERLPCETINVLDMGCRE